MLRRSVQRRYQEVVSYDEYEPRIKKLLNQHLKTSEVELLVQPLNLFDSEEREAELKRLGSDAARADAIASQTKKVISQKMNEDPAFYKKFSRMLQEAIDDWRARRISDAEYLGKSREISDKVINRRDDELPSKLQHYDDAKAYYGEVREVLEKYQVDGFQPVDQAAEAALKIDQIVEERRCVDWVQNEDVQNRMKTDIEDYLFELQESKHVPLSLEDIDQILDGCIRIARERRPQ
jgi:type I restriction enzyme R subunit